MSLLCSMVYADNPAVVGRDYGFAVMNTPGRFASSVSARPEAIYGSEDRGQNSL